MVSSRGGAGGRHRSGVRMPAPDRSTPASPWCCEPDGKYGAGACGTVDCCLEREPQSRTWRPLRSGVSCRLERRHMMDVVVERCAGLDVHRDSVVATVRVPGTGKSRRRRPLPQRQDDRVSSRPHLPQARHSLPIAAHPPHGRTRNERRVRPKQARCSTTLTRSVRARVEAQSLLPPTNEWPDDRFPSPRQRPHASPRQGQHLVSSTGGAGGRHRSGVRMPAPDRSTPASPCCCERDGKYGAGACGIADCCFERAP